MRKYKPNYFSILKGRKLWYYRILEICTGALSFGFLGAVVLLSIFQPVLISVFLIIYGFLWFLKASISGLYILYSFKNTIRYEKINSRELLRWVFSKPQNALEILENAKDLNRSSADWQERMSQDQKYINEIQDSNWSKDSTIYNIIVSITYNESPEILFNSLQAVYQNAFDLSKTIVIISQEERIGEKHNQHVRDEIARLSASTFNIQEFQENNLELVYETDHNTIQNSYKYTTKINLSKIQLNVIFTIHPDGLIGEIKASGPNANWGARQASLLAASLKIEPNRILLTKLDADHRIGKNYLEVLTYSYLINPNKDNIGFEPIPVFVNNFYQTNFVPRIIGIQSTFWVLTQNILPEELHFFMCYAVPMHTLREAGFWYREVISEECFLFYQCYFAKGGNFKTIPVYAPILVDAVEGTNFFTAFQNQYKQLQRWAWGAMEEFPYIFYKFFIDPNGENLDTRSRVKMLYLNLTNAIFWATSGLIFSFGVFLPRSLGGVEYNSHPVSLSLQNISLFFTIFSFSLLGFFAYIIYVYLGPKIVEFSKPRTTHSNTSEKVKPLNPRLQLLETAFQAIYMPLVYIIMMPFPALDAQFRSMFGKYLGYWVTPKGVKKE